MNILKPILSILIACVIFAAFLWVFWPAAQLTTEDERRTTQGAITSPGDQPQVESDAVPITARNEESKGNDADANSETPHDIHVAVRRGDEAAARSLIANDPSCVNVDVRDGFTGRPLNVAVRCNNYELTELLLKNGADVNAKGGWNNQTPIEDATTARMAKLLARYGADLTVNIGTEKHPESLLLDAARRGRVELAEAFIELGVPIDLESAVELGWTERAEELLGSSSQTQLELSRLLCHSAENGQLKTCEMLIANGADPNMDYGFINVAAPYTALSEAVTGNQYETAKFLCEHGANADASGGRGQDILLHHAIAFRDVRFIELLAEYGVDVNRKGRGGSTSLHVVCSLSGAEDVGRVYMWGQPQNQRYERHRIMAIARILISHGADVNARTSDGATPLLLAAITRHKELCDLLIASGARADLFYACALGDLPLISRILDRELPRAVLTKKVLGRTPLHWAVRSGNVHAVQAILEAGADPHSTAPEMNATDGDGIRADSTNRRATTVMHTAARLCSSQMIDLLISHEAIIGQDNKHGWNPLMIAVRHGNKEAVDALIRHGANINHRGSKGSSPVILAAANEPIMQSLIQAGAEIDHVTDDGKNALYFAARAEQARCVKILEEHGADVIDIETACMLDRPEKISTIFHATRNSDEYKKGSDKSLRKFEVETNPTFIALAAEYGSVRAIDKLIEHRAGFLADDFDRSKTPFHVAAKYGQINVLRYFVDRGMSVDTRSQRHATALLEAAENGQLETAEYLINEGADVKAVDERGLNVFHRIIQGHVTFLHDLHGIPTRDSRRRQVKLIQLLVDSGAMVDHRDGMGMTPLHLACDWGLADLAESLIQHGASLDARTRDNETPMTLAQKDRHTSFEETINKEKLVKYLKSLRAPRTRFDRSASVKLHDDAYVESLVEYTIPGSSDVVDILKLPHLDVVPAGETKPLLDVFNELGLSPAKMIDPRYQPKNKVVFVSWKISSSYYLSCMADHSQFSGDELRTLIDGKQKQGLTEKIFDPDFRVYGIRLLSSR